MAALALAAAAPAAAAPEVVVSIKPVHALVAGVMQGIAVPRLLVEGAASPHAYSLRPSEALALSRADVVFWIGPNLEMFLAKPLAALAGRARVVSLAEVAGMAIAEPRDGGGGADAHLWLDPANARRTVEVAARVLAGSDPANAGTYAANGARLAARLAALDAEVRALLAPVRRRPYLVFHDSLRHLERRYGLAFAGAVMPGAGPPPGARRVRTLRRKIVGGGAACVFHGPGPAPALVRTLIAGSGARAAGLDVLGAGVAAGPEAYFAIMRRLAAALAACLSAPP